MSKKKHKKKTETETKKIAKKETHQPVLTRRSFIAKALIGLGVVAFLEFIGVVFAFLQPRRRPIKEGKFGSIIEAGVVDDFTPNSVTAFGRGHFFLVRLDDGFIALSRQCTHLGCTIAWNEEKNQFSCPCHASAFDIKGDVTSRPAPRALDLYTVDIKNDIINVDTGKRHERKRFNSSQVTAVKKRQT
jgi:cytochrome b6-f complex iron-sulfur subunit